MVASFESGVSALANTLKLLRRPLTRAASHAVTHCMLPSRDGDCVSVRRFKAGRAVGSEATSPAAQDTSRPEKSPAVASSRSVAELISEAVQPRCH
jgi:hypothetical protein